MRKELCSRPLIIIAGIALLVLTGSSSAAGNGTAPVSCEQVECVITVTGVGTLNVRDDCRSELQDGCDSAASDECGSSGVSTTYLTNENIEVPELAVPDPFCTLAGNLTLRATGTATCNWECLTDPGVCEFTNETVCNGSCHCPTGEVPVCVELSSQSNCWGCSCVEGPFPHDPPGEPPVEGCNESPIVVDLGEPGITLTSLKAGVPFDIDGTDHVDWVAWLRPGSDNGWLGLDRNGNGCIDGGNELFGNHTEQPQSRDPNGYRALAVFDTHEHGGNDDGIISGHDAIFDDLVIWQDKDHDGLCAPEELETLSEAGIAAIGLSYTRVPLMDEHGNGWWYVASALLENGEIRQTVDVFLRVLHIQGSDDHAPTIDYRMGF